MNNQSDASLKIFYNCDKHHLHLFFNQYVRVLNTDCILLIILSLMLLRRLVDLYWFHFCCCEKKALGKQHGRARYYLRSRFPGTVSVLAEESRQEHKITSNITPTVNHREKVLHACLLLNLLSLLSHNSEPNPRECAANGGLCLTHQLM